MSIDTKKLKRFIKEYVPYVLIIIVVLLIKHFVVSPIRVNGSSMEDTLSNNDIMILDRISYRFTNIKRFDIVVVSTEKELIIKRVIGLPGESIEYIDNTLYINGKKFKDEYAFGDTSDFSIVVPKGKYYVLGDNRENSMDSRFFGAFTKNEILGKANLTLFPFTRFGIKE